jgi:hypothetical protein
MSLPPTFLQASEAAEGWLGTVRFIAHFGPSGSVGPLYELLLPTPDPTNPRGKRRKGKELPGWNLQDSYNTYAPIIMEALPLLAKVTDGPVRWEHGRGRSGVARVPSMVYPERWSSGHEASAGITRMALAMLASPLEGINDPAEQWQLAQQLLARHWKALVLPIEEVADLQERIRRERAALLSEKLQWTRVGSLGEWAKVFGVKPAIMAAMLKRGEVRHKKLTTKLYQIAVDDLPVTE